MPLLTPDDYPEVRAALHVNLSPDLLPNSVIAMDIHHANAEAQVIARDPQAESRVGEQAVHLRRAAIFLLGALLAPSVEMMSSESIPGGGYRYQRPEVDWATKAQLLRQRADEELSAVLEPGDRTGNRASLFTVARRRHPEGTR
jgi:hypothetical protein